MILYALYVPINYIYIRVYAGGMTAGGAGWTCNITLWMSCIFQRTKNDEPFCLKFHRALSVYTHTHTLYYIRVKSMCTHEKVV